MYTAIINRKNRKNWTKELKNRQYSNDYIERFAFKSYKIRYRG